MSGHLQMFTSLCIKYGVPVPTLQYVTPADGYSCDYTDEHHVKINIPAANGTPPLIHVAHTFGHYLADLHTAEGAAAHGEDIFDIVADAVAAMITPGGDCRTVEYDGAYQCLTHGRKWGAFPAPEITGPCQTQRGGSND